MTTVDHVSVPATPAQVPVDLPVPVVILGVLIVGTLLASLAKWLLGPRSHLSFPAAVLSGILGALVSSVLANQVRGPDVIPHWLFVSIAGVVGTVLVIVVAERFTRTPPPSTADLLAAGESSVVEFKSTARHNRHTDQRDDRMEMAITKSVAGLLNQDGGILLIGVDDQGTVLGLADDLQHMKKPDLDRYELWLHDHLARTLGRSCLSHVAVTFPEVRGQSICRIDVGRSPRPVFVRPIKTDRVHFYVRIGNSTRELPVDEAIDYAADHFPGGVRA